MSDSGIQHSNTKEVAARVVGVSSGTLLALVGVAIAEALRTVAGYPTPPQRLWAELPAVTLGIVPIILLAPAAASIVLDLMLEFADSRRPVIQTIAAVISVVVVGAFTGHWYDILTTYEPFQGYLPLQIGAGASAFALILHGLCNTRMVTARASLAPRVANFGAAVAGVGVYAANYLVYPGLYPTLHHVASLVCAIFLMRALSPTLRGARLRTSTLIAIPTAILLCASAVAVPRGYASGAVPYVFHTSELGRIASMSESLALGDSTDSAGSPVVDPTAVVRFRTANNLPALPADFRLEDYNVLVIASEATRYDKTSLAPDGPATTPNLATAAKRAWVAHRAYSPSSGTLHSMSALFTMKYPSAIDLATWMQPWFGQLSDGEVTVAELFSAADYETFWIGHNHNLVLSRSILGLDQGFDQVDLVEELTRPHSKSTDKKITAKVQKKLRALAKERDQRFFGFVFFASPHGPYNSHGYTDLPSKTQADKYLQEVRNVDTQFQTVFQALEDNSMLDNTIVIFLSDHGEEFREHGGRRHKSTVYSESIHVPLVVWAPPIPAGQSDAPVSTMYLFLWLLTRAESPELREPAERILRDLIGPILRETNNAVVSELVGHDRIKSTLIYDKYKLNYDYRSRLYELYDVEADPLEQMELLDTVDGGEWKASFKRYDAVRTATQAYSFLPKKRAPSVRAFRKAQAAEAKSRRAKSPR